MCSLVEKEGYNMLVRYKKSNEKIAMGLLSYMPDEKDVKKLQETIQQYDTDPNWHLFLWKVNEDFIGLVGIQSIDGLCTIQHVTVTPSHRGEGVGRAMLDKVKIILTCESIVSTEATKSFLQHCLN